MLNQAKKKGLYKKIWKRLKKEYLAGFCVSERGLQAALYAELRKTLPDVSVVVEPKWEVDSNPMTPDLVIVEEEIITDIFELKFKPHYYVPWKKDIEKLCCYAKKSDKRYPVRLEPETGQWKESLPVQGGCLLHFVEVGKRRRPKDPLPTDKNLNHWFGCTSKDDNAWDIKSV